MERHRSVERDSQSDYKNGLKRQSLVRGEGCLIEEPFLDYLAQCSSDLFVARIDIAFPRFATVWPACPVIVNHIRDGRIPVTASWNKGGPEASYLGTD